MPWRAAGRVKPGTRSAAYCRRAASIEQVIALLLTLPLLRGLRPKLDCPAGHQLHCRCNRASASPALPRQQLLRGELLPCAELLLLLLLLLLRSAAAPAAARTTTACGIIFAPLCAAAAARG